MLREAVTTVAVAVPFLLGFGTAHAPDDPDPLFRFQDPAIIESSGLAVRDGLVVTVNDSGDEARVFVVDSATGQTVGVTRWDGGAEDVEALAPVGGSDVWVGDIGDNAAVRDTVSVVRVPVGRGDRTVPGHRVTLRYPGVPADAEALLAHPGDGRLVVVTKSIFGGTAYVAPRHLATEGVNRLRPVGRVMPVVTDGAFFPDGRHLLLRDYQRARVYTWPGLETVGEFDLPAQPQGEGIAVEPGGRILVSSEGAGSAVDEVTLPPKIVAAMRPPEPSATPGDGSSSAPAGSREGRELAEDDPGVRDPTQWLIGTGLLVVALLVLWRALRPR